MTIEVTSRKGKVKLVLEERFRNWAGAIFGGIGGGVGGGCIMLPISLVWVTPILAPVAVVGWLGLVYGACRKIYSRRVRGRARKLQLLAEELDQVVRERHGALVSRDANAVHELDAHDVVERREPG